MLLPNDAVSTVLNDYIKFQTIFKCNIISQLIFFITCCRCHHREAVFFQSQSTRDEEGMRLYFVCTNPQCGHRWTQL